MLLITAGAACQRSTAPNAAIVEHRVRPFVTNGAITGDGDHFAWHAPDALGSSRTLVVLLPGTNGLPQYAQEIGRVAARAGFHAIGLTYPSRVAVVQACAGDPDPECMGAMRAEIITGADTSSHVTVDSANSIDGRLAALLVYLAAQHPSEGWSDFLNGSLPRWDRIVIGGQSQGGGHAAYIGTLRIVARVAMFGSPADGYDGQPAPWMAIGATPAERYYGFAHLRDPFLSIGPNWLALGLEAFGNVERVDNPQTMARTSHMLRTDVLPASGSYADAHTSVYGDFTTPRNRDGSPRYAPVWRYMFGTP